MIDAAKARAGGRVPGIAVTPRGYPAPRSSVEVVFGDHPVPGAASLRAGDLLLEFLSSARPCDAVLFLISGGGSAVAEVPAGTLTARDLAATVERLLASGAPIGAMNVVRRHLSALKGGGLAGACPTSAFATLALSDVVGDRPEDIASGPTVGDPTSFQDALEIVTRYRLGRRLPPRVLRYLRDGARGRRPETSKPSDPRLRRAPFVLAATNRVALEAAARESRRRGYSPSILSSRVTGETQPVARKFARRLLGTPSPLGGRPIALLSGGETTVTLGRRAGRGGRNQEFALAAAGPMAGSNALVLSIGSDGVDGPTDAAGGWTDGGSCARAQRRGINLERALAYHAAYDALAALGGLVRTGPTGTNVMDLHVGLRGPRGRGRAGSSRLGAAPSSRRRRS